MDIFDNSILKQELHDDETPFGGVSHAGEIVSEFIDEMLECNGFCPRSVRELNKALKECGISPIKTKKGKNNGKLNT